MASGAESTTTKDFGSDFVPAEAPGNKQDMKGSDINVVYKFCDLQKGLVDAWKDEFKEYIPDKVQVSSIYIA